MLAVVPVALLVFVLAAFLLIHKGHSVRAAYFFSILFVAILVALSALGGLARALGLAIADPKTSVPGCVEEEVDLDDFGRAQDLMRELQERFGELEGDPSGAEDGPIPFPGPFPIPDRPAVGAIFDCPESSGRSGAAAEAVRSGVLFALAAALAWANAVGARRLFNEEDQHAR